MPSMSLKVLGNTGAAIMFLLVILVFGNRHPKLFRSRCTISKSLPLLKLLICMVLFQLAKQGHRLPAYSTLIRSYS